MLGKIFNAIENLHIRCREGIEKMKIESHPDKYKVEE